MKSKLTLEKQIVRAAMLRGAAYIRDGVTHNNRGIDYFAHGVSIAVAYAAKKGFIPDEELEESEYLANLRREEERKRREALEREEAALKAELADIEAKEGE